MAALIALLTHTVATHILAGLGGFIFHVAWRKALGPLLCGLASRLIRNLF